MIGHLSLLLVYLQVRRSGVTRLPPERQERGKQKDNGSGDQNIYQFSSSSLFQVKRFERRRKDGSKRKKVSPRSSSAYDGEILPLKLFLAPSINGPSFRFLLSVCIFPSLLTIWAPSSPFTIRQCVASVALIPHSLSLLLLPHKFGDIWFWNHIKTYLKIYYN